MEYAYGLCYLLYLGIVTKGEIRCSLAGSSGYRVMMERGQYILCIVPLGYYCLQASMLTLVAR